MNESDAYSLILAGKIARGLILKRRRKITSLGAWDVAQVHIKWEFSSPALVVRMNGRYRDDVKAKFLRRDEGCWVCLLAALKW
jgi:hypothetical protein